MNKSIVALLITCLLSVSVFTQTDIRQKVEKIGIRENATVTTIDGKSYHGFIQKIEDTSFTIAEVDLRTDVSLAYSEVKKVQKGYGPKSAFSGRHTGPKKSWIPLAIVAGGLALPILIVATAKD